MDRVQYVYGTLTVKMLDVQRTESSAGRSSRWLRWGFLSLMSAFSAALWIHRQGIQGWTTYGYLGVLAFSLLANAMILLPAPVLAVVFTLGGVFSPLGIGMAAGLGMALGELTGYAAGRAGRIAESQVERLSRTDAWVHLYGFWAILLWAAIPVPLFDLVGLAAGAYRYPMGRFVVACLIGKTIKALAYAYAGAGFSDIGASSL